MSNSSDESVATAFGVPADVLSSVSSAASSIEVLASALAAMASTTGPTAINHRRRASEAIYALLHHGKIIDRFLLRRERGGHA